MHVVLRCRRSANFNCSLPQFMYGILDLRSWTHCSCNWKMLFISVSFYIYSIVVLLGLCKNLGGTSYGKEGKEGKEVKEGKEGKEGKVC